MQPWLENEQLSWKPVALLLMMKLQNQLQSVLERLFGDETLCHMDLHPMELCEEVSGEQFAEYDEFFNDDSYDDMVDDSPSVTSGVWQPYSEAQPEI